MFSTSQQHDVTCGLTLDAWRSRRDSQRLFLQRSKFCKTGVSHQHPEHVIASQSVCLDRAVTQLNRALFPL